MNLSYGPPGQHGVTTLMAVGSDDVELGTADRAIRRGAWIGAGAWLLGALTGKKTLQATAMGATLALVAVGVVTGSIGNKAVLVTQPAPVPAAGWRRLP